MPLRTIARITALRPGQSPPPVRTPNRMRRATYIQALTLLACSLLAAGCSSSSGRARGTTLTVYLSLPSHGVSARMAGDVAAGARLALAEIGARAGGENNRPMGLYHSE